MVGRYTLGFICQWKVYERGIFSAKNGSLHCSHKSEIYHVTLVTLFLARVKIFARVTISSFRAKAHLVLYFIGVYIIDIFLPCSINLFLHLYFTRMTAFVQFRKTMADCH